MTYEVILFDADGTLLDYEKDQSYALEKTFRDFGLDYAAEYHLERYRKINKSIWAEFENGLVSAEDLRWERFRRLFEDTGISLGPERFSDRYLNALSGAASLLNGAAQIVARLHKNHALGLVTNGLSSVQHPRIERSGLSPYFQAIVVSEDVGIAKPDPRIFQYALDEIGHADKSTVLVVGDSLSADVAGGLSLGIDACWLNPDRKRNTAGLAPTYEIRELVELEQILNLA